MIGGVARAQLAAWEDLARDWPVYLDPESPQMRCASCHMGVYRTRDDTGGHYLYSPEQTLALRVAHLRQAHMDLDPDR